MRFTDEQKKRIADAVLQAEKSTSGEIVPVIVQRSDAYPGARWRFAISLALLVSTLFYWFDPLRPGSWYLWAQLPALATGYLLGGLSWIQRMMLSDSRMSEEVHQRALQAFHSLGLTNTRDRTGILLMVSLLEHRVEILADTGIHSKVEAGTWDQIIAKLVSEIKSGKLAEGIEHAILECGKILTERFPSSGRSLDELSNKLIIED